MLAIFIPVNFGVTQHYVRIGNKPSLMRHTHPRQLQFYRMLNGREPFTEWYATIQNRNDRNRIQKRLDRLEDGNFGDCRSVGTGVFELRFHFGAGYRIYLVKWRTQLFFSSAGVTSRHRQGTLSGQRTIGCNTRGHNDEKTENMARVPNRTAC